MTPHALREKPRRRAAGGRPRRRLAPEVRRSQIMEAAVRLFARKGFARSTTRQIAREAGVAEGTIYRHFRSKEEILFSFLEATAFRTLGDMVSRAGQRGDAETLGDILRSRLELGERHAALLKVVLGEALFDRRLARALVRRIMMPASSILERLIAERIERGSLRPVDPALAARALIDHFLAYTLVWRGLAAGLVREIPPAEAAEGLVSIYLDGVARREAGP